jgi:hypothetical protein
LQPAADSIGRQVKIPKEELRWKKAGLNLLELSLIHQIRATQAQDVAAVASFIYYRLEPDQLSYNDIIMDYDLKEIGQMMGLSIDAYKEWKASGESDMSDLDAALKKLDWPD